MEPRSENEKRSRRVRFSNLDLQTENRDHSTKMNETKMNEQQQQQQQQQQVQLGTSKTVSKTTTRFRLDERSFWSVYEYFERDVPAVTLLDQPDQPDQPDHPYRNKRHGPPPYILDGASGAGKTQQAFSLAREHGSIHYVIPSAIGKSPQPIYFQMSHIFDRDGSFRKLLTDCRQSAVDLTKKRGRKDLDPFSEDLLVHFINTDEFNGLLETLCRIVVSFETENEKKVLYCGPVDVLDEKEKQKKFLERKILFIDEALPPGNVSEEERKDALDLLRFLRNTGRALGMRVVLAGTSAVVANMIEDPSSVQRNGAPSRCEFRDSFHWISCEFLCQRMTEQEFERMW